MSLSVFSFPHYIAQLLPSPLSQISILPAFRVFFQTSSCLKAQGPSWVQSLS